MNHRVAIRRNIFGWQALSRACDNLAARRTTLQPCRSLSMAFIIDSLNSMTARRQCFFKTQTFLNLVGVCQGVFPHFCHHLVRRKIKVSPFIRFRQKPHRFSLTLRCCFSHPINHLPTVHFSALLHDSQSHSKLCIGVALFSVGAQEPKPLIEAFLFCEVFQLTFNFRWNCRVCDCCAR